MNGEVYRPSCLEIHPARSTQNEGSMAPGAVGFLLTRGGIVALALFATCPAQAQDAKVPYPAMASVDQYLMADRNAEIALARSAAPEEISRNATVLVLGRTGYETAIEGTNRFTCIVERSWMSPFDSTEFWNPKIRGPICYNPPAVRTVLPYTLFRTKLVMAGLSKSQVEESVRSAVATGELKEPATGAMSYMLAKNQYLSDSGGRWHPHLMFHVPKTDNASWGANVVCSPSFRMTSIRMSRSRKPSSWCRLVSGRMGRPRRAGSSPPVGRGDRAEAGSDCRDSKEGPRGRERVPVPGILTNGRGM